MKENAIGHLVKTNPIQTQSNPIKPNFKRAKMNVSLYVIKEYENETAFRPEKTNPNKPQISPNSRKSHSVKNLPSLTFTLHPPVFPHTNHFFDLLWILPSQVIQFCSVFLKVVEFPVGLAVPDKFPFTGPNGFRLTKLPVQHLVSLPLFSSEDGQQ